MCLHAASNLFFGKNLALYLVTFWDRKNGCWLTCFLIIPSISAVPQHRWVRFMWHVFKCTQKRQLMNHWPETGPTKMLLTKIWAILLYQKMIKSLYRISFYDHKLKTSKCLKMISIFFAFFSKMQYLTLKIYTQLFGSIFGNILR